MKLRNFSFGLLFAVLAVLVFSTNALAQADEYQISAPVAHKNLQVFLIHGKSELTNENILTLQEAMERKILTVYETSNVNELLVQNKSSKYEVFIQSGDIVKGGKQDRVLSIDIIIPARSGKISIEAFCVESGRWEKRKNENVGEFSSSNERIVSKDLKLAANKARSQSEVWKRVEETQDKLSTNVGATVKSSTSSTSLQLSLENKEVTATVDEYVKKLSGIINGKTDVIGYAFVINGKINSADIYASNFLFKKLWLKLLKASAVEAVSELNEARTARVVKVSDIKAFLEGADRAKSEDRAVTDRVRAVTREDSETVVFESRDNKMKITLHKSYVKKQ
jgi:hypothetical protein